MELEQNLAICNIFTHSEWQRKISNRGDPYRAVARALIGGLNIHIFMLCPIDFFSNQVDFKRNQSGITQKYEYSTPPPPQLTL